MPAAADIVINDGATTPVAHTFKPSKVSDLNATYFGPGSTLSGRESIAVTRREATDTVAGKVNLKLTLPRENTVAGVTTVVYKGLDSVDLVFAPESTMQDRKDARVLLSNLLINPQIAAVIDNGEGIF